MTESQPFKFRKGENEVPPLILFYHLLVPCPKMLLSVQPLKAHGSLTPQETGEVKKDTGDFSSPMWNEAVGSWYLVRFLSLNSEKAGSSEQKSDYKNATFISALGPLFACLQCLEGSTMLTAFIFSMLWWIWNLHPAQDRINLLQHKSLDHFSFKCGKTALRMWKV